MQRASVNWFVRPSVFATIGVVNTAIDYLAFWALISLTGVSPVIANIASFSLGAANSFLMNTIITFRDRGIDISSRNRIKRFVLTVLLCLAVSTTVVAILVLIMHPLAAKSVSILITFTFGYVLNNRFVFKIRPQHVSDV